VKVLVTGVAGFVGSTLATRLLARGHDVVGLDALTDYYDTRVKRENLRSIAHSRLEVVEADLNDVNLDLFMADVEIVYHQAGQPGVRRSWGATSGTTRGTMCAPRRDCWKRRYVAAGCNVSFTPPRLPSTEMLRSIRPGRPTDNSR
jgi:GDP-D-mannose dehydratase